MTSPRLCSKSPRAHQCLSCVGLKALGRRTLCTRHLWCFCSPARGLRCDMCACGRTHMTSWMHWRCYSACPFQHGRLTASEWQCVLAPCLLGTPVALLWTTSPTRSSSTASAGVVHLTPARFLPLMHQVQLPVSLTAQPVPLQPMHLLVGHACCMVCMRPYGTRHYVLLQSCCGASSGQLTAPDCAGSTHR